MFSNRIQIKNIVVVMIAIVALTAGITSVVAKNNLPDTRKRMIVFGDSYSDNGNDYKLTRNQYPNPVAYYEGRFSNGPVWAEYFAKKFDINPNDPLRFLNYAYGQAKILQPTSITVHGSPDQQYSIPSFSEEIDSYAKQYSKINDNDIVVIFISTNDFFDISSTTTKDFFIKMADTQAEQIQRLIKMGAKHIVVLNGRDVTLSPLAKIVAHATTGSSDEIKTENYLVDFRNFIKIYNQRLSEKLGHIKEVVLYDIFEFDTQMTKKMNNKEMCYQNRQGDYQHVAGPICNNPNQFFYYDRIHTTSAVNSLLADDVYSKVSQRLK
jgi:phospholipase/lecithinase/hemolysin